MQTSYWGKYRTGRVSRRRVLAVTGATTFGVALFAACGGGEDEREKASSLVVEPKDQTKEAKRGGIYRSNNDRQFSTLDPNASGTTGAGRDMAYQRPLEPKPGVLEPAVTGEVQGDAASSWEYAGDKMTLTVKLRPENHFDARPPTNGRVVEGEDLVFTTNRIQAAGGRRVEFFNSINPDNTLLSWSAPDKSTVLFKLARPDPGFLDMLAQASSSYFHIMPREADGGFDPRNEQRGSGPFTLVEYVPSAFMRWKRNPGYWNKEFPLVDQVDWPIISEYSSGLAQFRAGQTFDYAVTPEDILPTKRDVPQLAMYSDPAIMTPGFRHFWGFKDSPKNLLP